MITKGELKNKLLNGSTCYGLGFYAYQKLLRYR